MVSVPGQSSNKACPYFRSQSEPDPNTLIKTSTLRDQIYVIEKGKAARSKIHARLKSIIASKMQAYMCFCGIINKKETRNPYSNEAIILRKRMIVCIIDEFRHGINGQTSRFLRTSEGGYREMGYTEPK